MAKKKPKKRPSAAQLRASTAKAQARFLAEFARCGNVVRSARACGFGRSTVYLWRDHDKRFETLYNEAHQDALDLLEEEARRRAVDGVLEPVYQGGEKVGSIRKYSDTLLVTLLKGKRPETFRDRFEHMGKDGGPIQTAATISAMSDEQLFARMAELLEKAKAKA